MNQAGSWDGAEAPEAGRGGGYGDGRA